MTTEITLILDDDLLARVRAAAAQAGLSPQDWATRALTEALRFPGLSEDAATFDATARGDDLLAKQTPEARAFQHAAALAALEEYDRTGEYVALEDVLAEVRADLETRLAAKG